jgi:hypothetical protein
MEKLRYAPHKLAKDDEKTGRDFQTRVQGTGSYGEEGVITSIKFY